MRILGQPCFVTSFCASLELQKRVLRIIIAFVLMDYASCLRFLKLDKDLLCGVLMVRLFPHVLKLSRVVLMFCLVLMVLHSCRHLGGFLQVLSDLGRKTSDFRSGVCSKIGLGDAVYTICGNCGPRKFSKFSSTKTKKNSLVLTEDANAMSITCTLEKDHHDVMEQYDEDEELDVVKLRKMVKAERQRANEALAELDKERMAAASATEEALGMILRLQSEMSSLNIQANQFKRLAEQKLLYKQEKIHSLYHMAIKQHDQLSFYRQKLNECREDNDLDNLEEIEENLRMLACTIMEGFQ